MTHSKATVEKPRLITFPRRRIEIAASGIDEELQGIGGDPYGGTSWEGLRVPARPTPSGHPENRYLFQLASFKLPEAARARIVGLRQYWSLGLQLANGRIVEQGVTDPFFKLPDGNVSWHLRIMGDKYPSVANPGKVFDPATGPQQNLAWENSDTPGLLFQTVASGTPFYTQLTGYTPPNGGKPWGHPVAAGLGTFNALKTTYREGGQAWHSLDEPVTGPCRVALFASVQQTDPTPNTGRSVITPVPNPFYAGGLSAEEQFLLNFPAANIWRVGGALIVEMEDFKP
jgi:hypothetical protein